MVSKIPVSVRDLGPVFLVAMSVALLSTLAGSVLDHVHQIDAESLVRQEATAKPLSTTQQTLAIKDWGLQMTFPLAAEMPLVVAATHDSTSVGFSSVALEKYGPSCSAARNALGSLIRYPKDAAVRPQGSIIQYVITQIGDYEYVYQTPDGSCSQAGNARALITQQTSVLREYMDSLATIRP